MEPEGSLPHSQEPAACLYNIFEARAEFLFTELK